MSASRTAVEPLFDLASRILGTIGNHKGLSIKGLANVCPLMSLRVLTIQITMIANRIWGLPLHNIFHMVLSSPDAIVHTPQLCACLLVLQHERSRAIIDLKLELS